MSLSNQSFVSATNVTMTPTPYRFMTAVKGPEQESGCREHIERFIKRGFFTAYQAELTRFMPVLIGIKAKALQAAVGIRCASQPLFIEQYLPLPITHALEQHGIWTQRANIAELGNLYSINARVTLPLLLGVVMGLYLSGIEYLVFAATLEVRQLLAKLTLPLIFLDDAHPNKLPDTHRWGSYYDHQPKVMLLDIHKAITVIDTQPALNTLLHSLQAELPVLLTTMRSL